MPSTLPLLTNSEKKLKMPFGFTPLCRNYLRQVCNQPGALKCPPLPEIHKSMANATRSRHMRSKSIRPEKKQNHCRANNLRALLHSLCFCSIVSWPTPGHISPCHMYLLQGCCQAVTTSCHRQHVSNMYRRGRRPKAHSTLLCRLWLRVWCVCALQFPWAWHSERICSLSRSESTCEAMNRS